MTALQSVVAFFAHPDDETVLAGGIIALLVERGVNVQIVCATRGEGGELGDPPVAESQDLLGEIREAELQCAVSALGANLTQMDYIDPVITEGDTMHPFEADFDTLTCQFAHVIDTYNPQVVLTHGTDGEYGHPAHQLVNKAVTNAIKTYKPETMLYTIAAYIPNSDDEDRLWNKSDVAHYVLNIESWAKQKIKAMECHVSQHALFKRRRELKTVAEALRSTESVHRAHPIWNGTDAPQDAFSALLIDGGAWSPQNS